MTSTLTVLLARRDLPVQEGEGHVTIVEETKRALDRISSNKQFRDEELKKLRPAMNIRYPPVLAPVSGERLSIEASGRNVNCRVLGI